MSKIRAKPECPIRKYSKCIEMSGMGLVFDHKRLSIVKNMYFQQSTTSRIIFHPWKFQYRPLMTAKRAENEEIQAQFFIWVTFCSIFALIISENHILTELMQSLTSKDPKLKFLPPGNAFWSNKWDI